MPSNCLLELLSTTISIDQLPNSCDAVSITGIILGILALWVLNHLLCERAMRRVAEEQKQGLPPRTVTDVLRYGFFTKIGGRHPFVSPANVLVASVYLFLLSLFLPASWVGVLRLVSIVFFIYGVGFTVAMMASPGSSNRPWIIRRDSPREQRPGPPGNPVS